jgi:hypothetical protein
MNEMKNPIAMPSAEYIPVAETAKLIRKVLAKAFPGQKFGVRSKSYSGGASIDISYEGGPAHHLVDAAVEPFRGSDFDGMIDGSSHNKSWLAPDGSVSHAFSAGTVGSMGCIYPSYGDAHAAGCRYVQFGADFVSVDRQFTKAEYWAAVAWFEKESGRKVRHEVWRDGSLIPLHHFVGIANGAEFSVSKIEDRHADRLLTIPFALDPVEVAERAKYIPA